MLLTIFTPTYNRRNTLNRLYDSLCRQSNKDFEWIVVDDGSSDGTDKLIDECIEEKKINIRYYYQKNAGKTSAHNKGVELANGNLFVCVDSDDMLVESAVERIHTAYKNMKENNIGIIAFRYNISDNKSITSIKDGNVKHATLNDLYNVHGMTGDTMIVYRSILIKKYKFPEYNGEKFIPEAYLYDLLDQDGSLYILRENLYGCEYLQDGYTANMARLLYNNPNGYFTFINQRLKFDKKIKNKLLDSIRYDAMAIAHKEKHYVKKAVYPIFAAAAVPLGYVFYVKRYKKFTRE